MSSHFFYNLLLTGADNTKWSSSNKCLNSSLMGGTYFTLPAMTFLGGTLQQAHSTQFTFSMDVTVSSNITLILTGSNGSAVTVTLSYRQTQGGITVQSSLMSDSLGTFNVLPMSSMTFTIRVDVIPTSSFSSTNVFVSVASLELGQTATARGSLPALIATSSVIRRVVIMGKACLQKLSVQDLSAPWQWPALGQ